jgi:3-oxoacyl-[acyl-carrier-protein] synthase II
MKIYIRATANISPQETFGNVPFLQKVRANEGNMLKIAEPDYKAIIDPKLLRRMSRIIKMGVATASQCLKNADETSPGAIVTGTAYGCLEDTDLFLQRMLTQGEELLSPTPFIQSTHNTVGAQIALMLNCHEYNNTFVHRGFSFESALLDAIMLLQENAANTVLVGSADEITDVSHLILSRLGLYKQAPVCNTDLYTSGARGTIAGEGAAFFLLSAGPSQTDYAAIDGLATFYKPKDPKETENEIRKFLKAHAVNIDEIDLIITGKNGDPKNDAYYDRLNASIFRNKAIVNYKHLCGEYPTSSSFALWLAANIIKWDTVPAVVSDGFGKESKIKRILIYNNYFTIHHSLMLVSAC